LRVLADTGIWSRHFRDGEPRLARLLGERQVVTHPWIVGELALGPGLRLDTLADLEVLPALAVVPDPKVLDFVKLHGVRGIGWIDVQLLVAALAARVEVWTTDLCLAETWRRFRVS